MLNVAPLPHARPGKYQRRQSDHIPLGGVARSEPLHICDMAPVVFSWDARAHNPLCYLCGALGDAGAAAASDAFGRRDPGATGNGGTVPINPPIQFAVASVSMASTRTALERC